jgi:hypothetical protein
VQPKLISYLDLEKKASNGKKSTSVAGEGSAAQAYQ